MPLRPVTDKDAITIPPEFKLEEDLAMAFHIMEFTDESLFLTGRAGTGKSTLLNYFRKNTVKKYVVLAPTGLAALQVGGNTIHSFFGFPLRTMMKNDPEIYAWGKGHPRLRILKKMDVLIIDEISMVRVDLLDAIDHALRLNMGNDLPFGGKQVIFIGDVFQLSPVVQQQDYHTPDFDEYSSQYFFSADAFRAARPKVLELKKIYRQQDDDFIYLLNRVRKGVASQDDLDELNKRYLPTRYQEDFAIVLTSVNAIADQVNLLKLIELPTTGFVYKGKTEGTFYERLYPSSTVLTLKEGAQVMMIKNDVQGRWVNGSIGKVVSLTPEEIHVKFADGKIHRVEPVTWENKTYKWDRETNAISFEVHGTYTQYPIRHAWAITIHKSQGLTFEKVIIDMGKGAFAHGQLYVALSRCKTLEGITLKTKIQLKDMIVDEAVEYFAGRGGIG
jgi:ATP-dependent DNA helicase PIF1